MKSKRPRTEQRVQRLREIWNEDKVQRVVYGDERAVLFKTVFGKMGDMTLMGAGGSLFSNHPQHLASG